MYRRRRLAAPKRMTKEWVPFWTFVGAVTNPSFVTVPGANLFLDWALTPAQAYDIFDEPTLIRLIGGISVAFNGVAANAGMVWSAGLLVTRDNGTTGAPPPRSPMADGGDDWIWTWYGEAHSPTATAGAAGGGAFGIDSASKRKIPPGNGLAFYFENLSPYALNLYAAGRALYAHA